MIQKILLSVTIFLFVPVQHAWAQQDNLWRLYSRFGYAPNQPNDKVSTDIKALALKQLEQAKLASHSEPLIPESFSILKTTLPEANLRWREERNSQASLANTPPKEFSKDIVRASMSWRIYQCSHATDENPLLAKMTEFWFNHFNVYAYKGSVQPFVADYLIHAIRPNVLGNFEDLLIASFKHPAMLYYLDQWLNSSADASNSNNRTTNPVKGVNENYAREVLELHTMGANSGYEQRDVLSLARILTGWTVSANSPTGSQFVPRFHDKGEKILLGQTFSNSGEEEAIKALKFLSSQPQTAHRISLRLAQWFVSDHPPPLLVESMTRTFLESHGNLLKVMTTLIESDETWDSKNTLLKTPLDFVCSALTLYGGAQEPKDYATALGFLANSGQPMNAWQTPDGYGSMGDQWLSSEALSRRADFAFFLGSRMNNADKVLSWIPEPNRSIINRERPNLQASFSLASPDFMRK